MLVAVTWVFVVTAPLGSRTSPVMEPNVCADAKFRHKNKEALRSARRMGPP